MHDYALAMNAVSRVNFEESRQYLLSALKRDANFGPAYSGLAMLSLNEGRPEEAERHAREAIRHLDRMTEREGSHARGLLTWLPVTIRVALRIGDLVARFPQDTGGRNNLALCASKARDLTKAVDEMRRTVEILPKRSLYRGNLSLYAGYSSNLQLAEQEARASLELGGAYYGWLSLAFAQLAQGQVPQAITLLKSWPR